MYSEVAWVPVSYRIQVQPQIILNPDYLSDSYDYGFLDFLECSYAQYVEIYFFVIKIERLRNPKIR